MSDDSPTLGDVFDAAFRKALRGLRVAMPGEIRSYDASTRRATVQPMIPDGWIDEDGERQATTLRPLTDVPVAQTGSGSVRVKFPIRPGDPCWLIFSSSCLTAWKASGRLLDPGDDRHHHEADAIAIPIARVTGSPPEDDTMIEFTDDNLIRAGGDEPLVRRSEFLGHTHATAGTGTPSPPISGPPGSAATFPGTDKLRG